MVRVKGLNTGVLFRKPRSKRTFSRGGTPPPVSKGSWLFSRFSGIFSDWSNLNHMESSGNEASISSMEPVYGRVKGDPAGKGCDPAEVEISYFCVFLSESVFR